MTPTGEKKRIETKAFNAGFNAGVIAALAALRVFDEPTIYDEIVKNCAPAAELVKQARRDGNMRWSGLDRFVRRQKGLE